MRNIIDEYLVSLGYTLDKKSIKESEDATKKVKESFKALTKVWASALAGLSAIVAGLVGFTKAIEGIGHQLGNVTMGVDKFALSLYTSQRNARSLQTVMQAMGIENLEDLKYINLIPEQRQQFLALRQMTQRFAPSKETMEGLSLLKQTGFKFQKMWIELNYTWTKFLGDFGRFTNSPFFKLVIDILELIIAEVAYIAEKVGKHPLQALKHAAIGAGVTALTVGGGAALLGAPLGPIGMAATATGGAALGLYYHGHKKEIDEWAKKTFGANKDPHGYKAYAVKQAEKYGVDPSVLMSQIEQESHWNPTAKSDMGARGIAQIMPSTAKSAGVNPLDPFASIEYAAKHLRDAVKKHGSYEYALAGYNGGPGAVPYFKKHGGIFYNPHADRRAWSHETALYVKSIMGHSRKLQMEAVREYTKTHPTPPVPNTSSPTTPQKVSVNITVNGAHGPMQTAHAIKEEMQTFFLMRNNESFA